MSSSTIRAGKAEVEVGLSDSKLVAGLKAVKPKLLAVGSSIVGIGASAVTGGLAIAAAGVASIGAGAAFAAKMAISTGDAFADMSARTGVSAEKLQALKYAAEQGGAGIEDVEKAVRKMQQGIAGGDKSFEKYGLSLATLQAMSPDEQFAAVADAIAKIDDPTNKSAAAMELLGKSGAQLVPMLSDGSKGLAEMEAKARDLGLVMSNDDVAAAGSLADTLGQLWAQVQGVAIQVGSAFVPAMQAASNGLSAVVRGITGFLKENRGAIDSVIQFGTHVGATMIAAGAAVGQFVSTGVGHVQEFVGKFTSGFSGIGEETRKTMSAIATAVSSGNISAAVDVLWAQIGVLWAEGVAKIAALWDTAWKTSFVQAAADGMFNIASAMVEGWARIKAICINISFELKNDWGDIFKGAMDELASYPVKLWESVVGAFKSEWELAKSAVNSVIYASEKGKHTAPPPPPPPTTDEKADQKKKRDEDRKAALEAADAERRAALEELTRLRGGNPTAIGGGVQSPDAMQWTPVDDGSGANEAVDTAQKRLEDARKKLDDLRAAQDGAGAPDGAPDAWQFDLAKFRKSLGLPPLSDSKPGTDNKTTTNPDDPSKKTTTSTAATDSIKAAGTFSARAASGLTAGPLDAIKRNTQRTADGIAEANRRKPKVGMEVT